ncbi:nicotinate (nicotinamide) nucleotide adenylyltransferase [Paraferrimonas haliotis]|uniref:Probable nicotinate-nucleotide adenylyltransferase n=1 Tax=Paraferrimonas haliotis TaxID=2013866 RepID=A0AA37WXL9_9GAMM|nr:nicotinate (nicotinamide) nucleotide adenylyltransferase [Paraferrimonas haliotis]GLS83569.1 putative nicotinate-nucleotide adenylyltransferase [Paraferrimonas haliotis]
MKVGLLGGTFDPIHLGHSQMAKQLLAQTELDEIWFLPNKIPPHKAQPQASFAHRYNMVKLACTEHSAFKVCSIENELPSPSYTLHTLKALRTQYPLIKFSFIIGMDSAQSLPTWHHWRSIFDYCDIIACARPGWSADELSDDLHPLRANRRLAIVAINEADVASNTIRSAIKQGTIANQALNPSVIRYINQHRLYIGG